MTVVADGIVEADVLATAVLAGGPEVLDHVTATRDIDVLAIGRDGEVLVTRESDSRHPTSPGPARLRLWTAAPGGPPADVNPHIRRGLAARPSADSMSGSPPRTFKGKAHSGDDEQ